MIEGADRQNQAAEVGDAEVSTSVTGGESAPSSADYSVAFTPRQVAVGFAILAGLVAFALSRRRRKRSRED